MTRAVVEGVAGFTDDLVATAATFVPTRNSA